MESSDYQQDNQNLWENLEALDYAQKFQTYKLYSILCLLLKSEAIFTFFVYWVRGLELTSGTIGLPNHNTLSHLWLLKPFFSLIIDKLNIPISQTQEYPEENLKIPRIVQYRPSDSCSLLGISNYRVLVLLLAEFILAFCSIIIYFLYYINYLHTIFTKIFIYLLSLSLVCASSYAEGLFCRYVRSKEQNSYVKLVSLRLILSSIYGLTTILFLILPVMFPGGYLGKFLQINFLFPVFLLFNAIFVAIMASKHFFPPHLQNLQERWPLTPTASPVQMTTGPEPTPNDFSFGPMASLLALLIISMRMKNDFYNKYNHSVPDIYLYLLSSQFFKIVTSSIIYLFLGPRAVIRISMGIFGLSILLLYPFNSYIDVLYNKMAHLGHIQTLLAGFFLSSIQQFLLTYSILLGLFIAVRGFEAWTLSLPTFATHLTHMCLRHGIIDYLDLTKRQSFCLRVLTFFFFSYCFKVLFRNEKLLFHEKSDTRNTNSDNNNSQKLHYFTLPKSMYNTQLPSEVKSLWEQYSDFSYESDVL